MKSDTCCFNFCRSLGNSGVEGCVVMSMYEVIVSWINGLMENKFERRNMEEDEMMMKVKSMLGFMVLKLTSVGWISDSDILCYYSFG